MTTRKRSPARYTYFFTDLLTNAMRGRVRLSNVSLQNSLSSPGQFSAELNLSSSKLKNFVLTDVIEPQRTAYWVDRNGQLISGGIIWNDDYDSSTDVYSMSGATFDSFADHERIDDFLFYSQVDLNIITTRLWTDMQSRVGSNIGMILPAEGTKLSGTLNDAEYDPSQQTFYGSAIQTLSQQQPGFDYYVQVSYDSSNNFTKKLILGTPYVGVAPSQTNLVFRYPGNIMKYTWPRAGDSAPNDVISTGGGGGGAAGFTSSYRNQARIDAGYPLVQATTQFKDTYDQTKLDALTNAYGVSVSSIPPQPVITLAPNRTDVPVGSFACGDPCRIIIAPCRRFPNGVDTNMRIQSYTVNPPNDGNVEAVSINLGPVQY